MPEPDETPDSTPRPDSAPGHDPDTLDDRKDDPIQLDDDLIFAYRAYLHGDMYQEIAEHYPGRIDFGDGIIFEPDDKCFTVDTGYDLGQLCDPNATLQVRIDELVAEGLDGESAENQARDELLSADADFHAWWSDDLVPRVIVRIASLEALAAELEPLLTAAGVRMSLAQVRDYVDLWFGEWFEWSEVHWMDRCEPVRADLPVAWRSPGGSLEVLEKTSGEEDEHVARFFTAEGWQDASFDDLSDEAEEGRR